MSLKFENDWEQVNVDKILLYVLIQFSSTISGVMELTAFFTGVESIW